MKPPVAEIEAEKIFLDFERKRKAQEVLGESEPRWSVWLIVLVSWISTILALPQSQGWFNTSGHTFNFFVVGMSMLLVAVLCQVWYLSRCLEAAIEIININNFNDGWLVSFLMTAKTIRCNQGESMKPPIAEIEAAKISLDERKRKAQEVLGGSKPWWFVWLYVYVLVAPISANLASQGWFNTPEQTVNFLALGMSTWLVAALYQVWYLSRHLEAAIELIKLNDERQSGRSE